LQRRRPLISSLKAKTTVTLAEAVVSPSPALTTQRSSRISRIR
jgi:hypothetical protein